MGIITGDFVTLTVQVDNDSIYKMASCEMGEVSETAVPTYLTNLYPTDHDDRILFLKLFSLNTSEFW